MIKFFRKIRQNLLMENKTGKYFKYAIGEIVLVVIGILIALQINNWNEKRGQEKTVKSIYSIIKSDLTNDIEKFDKIINKMALLDTVFKKVIQKKMTLKDYQNCPDCVNLLMGYQDIAVEERGLKLLTDNGALFDAKKDSLFIDINSFYSYYNTEISVSLKEMSDNFQDNWFYWKNNKPWFSDFYNRVKNDDLISYMLNSWDYRNRVAAAYILHYEVYLNQLVNYKKDALKIIEDINIRTE